MGVTGLWRLIDASGKPVPIETLEGKILAIDISIWIHQALQGYQDRRGQAVPNAHLLSLYNRICKLLYFKIKPVFVFDGDAPLLKKNTIAARKKHKAIAAGKAELIKNDLLHNLMKHSLVKGVLAKRKDNTSESEPLSSTSSNINSKELNDIFSLPELPSSLTSTVDYDESDDSDSPNTSLSPRKEAKWKGNIHNVDVNTNDFKSLPADVRYDILTDLKETRKQNSWGRLHEMPDDSQQFSSFQMKRLLKRRQVQESLETAEREMGGKTLTLEELDKLMTDQGVNTTTANSKVFRIASNSLTRMIYINDPKKLTSSQEAAQEDSNSTEDLSQQPSCSSANNVHELYPIEEESLLNNINDYDLDNEWDSDIEVVNNIVSSPTVKKYFGKASNPVMAYMQAQSGLSQEKILEFIQQNKEQLTSKESDENKQCKRKIIKEGKNVFTNRRKKTRTDSESSLEALEEMIKIKEEMTENEDEIPDLSESHSPKNNFMNDTQQISSESDSDDFVEVHDVPIPELVKPDNRMEIIVKTNDTLDHDDDDLFADVFQEKSLNSSSNCTYSNSFLSENSAINISTVSTGLESINSSIDEKKMEFVNSISKEVNDVMLEDDNQLEKISEKSELKTTNNPEVIKIPETLEVKCANSHKPAKVPKKNEIKSINLPDVVKMFDNSEIQSPCTSESPEMETSFENQLEDASDDIIIPTSPKTRDDGVPEISNQPVEAIGKKRSERIEQLINRLEEDKNELIAQAYAEPNLEHLQSELESQQLEIRENIGKLERQTLEVTEQMRSEAQDLLRLFGIPYVVAPQEAEAQCAYLELINLTHGTITDDSDIWLFGGRCVYKNFFNNAKRVLQFQIKDIEHHFKLTRPQMIQLALLVGSDYTLGIPGIGPVTAMEILANFPTVGDDILRGLTQFSTWMRAGKPVAPGKTTLRNKLKNVDVDGGFPSHTVAQAYLAPCVDESTEQFSWTKPNLVLLNDYTREKFGWSKVKFDETMGPVIKKLSEHKSQKTLLNYYKINNVPASIEQNLSKRVQKAVQKMGRHVDANDLEQNPDDPDEECEKGAKKKRKTVKKKNNEPNEPDVNKADDEPEGALLDQLLSPKLNVKNRSTKKTKEIIPQREKDRAEAMQKKRQAIEVFKKSNRGKRGKAKKPLRKVTSIIKAEAELSESSSDNN